MLCALKFVMMASEIETDISIGLQHTSQSST